MTEKDFNDMIFADVKTCKCGCRNGAYVRKDDEGYWYVCNDCDLPIFSSYHLNESSHTRRREDEYED